MELRKLLKTASILAGAAIVLPIGTGLATLILNKGIYSNSRNLETPIGYVRTNIGSAMDYPRIALQLIRDSNEKCWAQVMPIEEIREKEVKDIATYIWKHNGRQKRHKQGDIIEVPIYCENQRKDYLVQQ